VDSLKDLIPTRRLVEHEWNVHGSCTGQSLEQFFALLRQAYDSISFPQLVVGAGDWTQTIHQVVKAFTNRDHGLAAQAIVLTCSDNPARLREIRVCLSRNLASNYCIAGRPSAKQVIQREQLRQYLPVTSNWSRPATVESLSGSSGF
jgi:ribonuclease T2